MSTRPTADGSTLAAAAAEKERERESRTCPIPRLDGDATDNGASECYLRREKRGPNNRAHRNYAKETRKRLSTQSQHVKSSSRQAHARPSARACRPQLQGRAEWSIGKSCLARLREHLASPAVFCKGMFHGPERLLTVAQNSNQARPATDPPTCGRLKIGPSCTYRQFVGPHVPWSKIWLWLLILGSSRPNPACGKLETAKRPR